MKQWELALVNSNFIKTLLWSEIKERKKKKKQKTKTSQIEKELLIQKKKEKGIRPVLGKKDKKQKE